MARLSRLEENFEKDYRDAFEDMATHMLVAEFSLPNAPLRRRNQALFGRLGENDVLFPTAGRDSVAERLPFVKTHREAPRFRHR